MSFGISIKGGESWRNRRRRIRPKAADWFCRCVVAGDGTWAIWKKQRGYLNRCVDCGTDRPG